MLTDEQKLTIYRDISGPRAQDLIARLSALHRIPGGRDILQAMNIIREEFEAAGLEQIRLERFPVGKDHSYWSWDIPYIWEQQDAHLAIVSPESERKIIVRFSETPISLLGGSSPTSPQGWSGELVDVGRGEAAGDYSGKRIRGRLVLTHGNPSLVHLQAVTKRGAAGMLVLGSQAPDLDHPDKIMTAGISMRASLEHPFFGFALSHRQHQELQDLLHRMNKENKSVHIFARVKARFRTGQFRALSAVIRGMEQPAKELILVAHICHPKPSANDNASGCALLAEMARTLVTLQKRGALPPLKRSLRFLVVPEWRGTVPWLHRHRRQAKNMLAVVSLDMVGEDQERCGSTLLVGSTHGVQQHFSGQLLERAFRWVADQKGPSKLRKESLFRWKTEKYFGGTDHMPFVDPTIGVPGLYVGHPQDYFWHTSEDTLDKTDPNTLERVGAASLIFACDLLNLSDRERETILSESYLEAAGRLAAMGRDLVEKISGFVPKKKNDRPSWLRFHRDHLKRRRRIDHELEVEAAVLASCTEGMQGRQKPILTAKTLELTGVLAWQAEEIRGLVEEAYQAVLEDHRVDGSSLRWRKSSLENKAAALVVHRRFEGPFPIIRLMDKVARKDSQWLAENFVKLYRQRFMEIPFFYIDGQRTILEVAEKLEFEYGPCDLKILTDYLHVLARAKLVHLTKKRKS